VGFTLTRVVVTGCGAITPVGNAASTTWRALIEGRSGLVNLRTWLEDQLPGFDRLRTHLAGPVAYDLLQDEVFPAFAQRISRRQYDREVSRAAELALRACAEALTDAGLVDETLLVKSGDPARLAVVLGSGIGGALDLGDRYAGLLRNHRPHSTDLYRVQPDNATVVARRFFGAEGSSLSMSQACASGGMAIAVGAMLIETGGADVVVAGGTEGLGALVIALFESTGAANPSEEPKNASQPLDVNAGGAVLSEGAGVLILEDERHALRRGANIRAVVAGYGITGGKGSASLLDEEGVLRAMESALSKARVGSRAPLAINPHATGTKAGDRGEARTIHRLMTSEKGRPAPRNVVKVFPIKGGIGHSIGAAGGIEAVISVVALEECEVPPAATTSEPLAELRTLVPGVVGAEPLEADYVLSNSMGFGDQNVSIVIGKYGAS
jgi:3-oxoacyl-[acyl-carrier-protein] synthase II